MSEPSADSALEPREMHASREGAHINHSSAQPGHRVSAWRR
jgi:hypothetical protein